MGYAFNISADRPGEQASVDTSPGYALKCASSHYRSRALQGSLDNAVDYTMNRPTDLAREGAKHCQCVRRDILIFVACKCHRKRRDYGG